MLFSLTCCSPCVCRSFCLFTELLFCYVMCFIIFTETAYCAFVFILFTMLCILCVFCGLYCLLMYCCILPSLRCCSLCFILFTEELFTLCVSFHLCILRVCLRFLCRCVFSMCLRSAVSDVLVCFVCPCSCMSVCMGLPVCVDSLFFNGDFLFLLFFPFLYSS